MIQQTTRVVFAAVLTLCVAMVGLAAAADVTFVLNSGERQSGTLAAGTKFVEN